MARIRIRRQADGSYTIRVERLAGKALRAGVRANKITKDDVGTCVERMLREVGNPGDRVKPTEDTASKRGVT